MRLVSVSEVEGKLIGPRNHVTIEIMNFKNRIVPYAALAFLVTTQAIVIFFQIDFWPFSRYPMFSTLHSTEDVGAYRMEALTRNQQTLTVYLRGSKNTWQAYETLLKKNDIQGLQAQMLRDIDYYFEQHPAIEKSEVIEVRLVSIGMMDNANKEKTVTQKVLHRMSL